MHIPLVPQCVIVSCNVAVVKAGKLIPVTKQNVARVYVLLMLTFSVNVSAQDASLPVITLEQAIARSLEVHPDLRAYRSKAKAAAAATEQAGMQSPKQFAVNVEDFAGSGSYSGVKGLTTNLSISWLLEEETVAAKTKLASEKALRLTYEKQQKALDIAAKTASFFITILSQKAQLKLAKQALIHANDAFGKVQQRVQSGSAHQVELLRAKANVAQKELVVEDLTHEIEASRAKLGAQWQGDDNFMVTGKLSSIPSVASIDNLYLTLLHHPKIKQFSVEETVADAAITLAKVEEKPSWQVNAGLKHNAALDDFAITAGISIPFGTKNRNQGKIRQLQYELETKKAELNAWQKHTSTRILLVSHQLKHNRHVIDGLSSRVIPALEKANELAESAYQQGLYRFSEWYDVQQEQVEAQSQLIDAYNNVHLLTIELQRLTGSNLAVNANNK